MAVHDAVDALGLLADDTRLRAMAALVLGARSLADVVAAGGLDQKTAMRALTRLESGGLVQHDAAGWQVCAGRLGAIVRAATPTVRTGDEGVADPGAAAVLRAFVRDGRLTSIPAAHSKRLVVLDHVVRVFEPGVRYPERDVNALLRAFHPDCAALRRHLVDEGFLAREDRIYWRIGGTVDV